MEFFQFDLDFKILGKGRPRASLVNGRMMIYTPKASRECEKAIAGAYKAQGGQYFGSEAVRVCITIYSKIPKSISVKTKNAMLLGKVYPKTKPDIDNVAKTVLDALNGIAYEDDKQVASLYLRREYAKEDGARIWIMKLDEVEDEKDSNHTGISDDGNVSNASN